MVHRFLQGLGQSHKRAGDKNVCLISTTELEYVSLSDGSKTALWLNALDSGLNSFPVPMEKSSGDEVPPNPVEMYCNNQSAICLKKNPVHQRRSKHIDVRYHFVRQLQENNKIAV
jgi:hypothetical protein